MELINGSGNLFGHVNVIDASVVVVVITTVAGGVTLVTGDDAEPGTTTQTGVVNATLELGTQSTYIVEAIRAGDTHLPTGGGGGRLTVTDAYISPVQSETRVVVSVRLSGGVAGDSIVCGNALPRLGRVIPIETSAYEVNGQIRAIGGNGTLRHEQKMLTVRTSLTPDQASAVDVGDRVTVAGRTVATVRRATFQPGEAPDARLAYVTVPLQTNIRDGIAYFAGRPVREGTDPRLSTPDFIFDGTMIQVGSVPTVRRQTVVFRSRISSKRAGDRIRVAGETTARLRTSPSTVRMIRIVNGLPSDCRCRLSSTAARHGSAPTSSNGGNNISIRTNEYDFTANIERVGATTPRGTLERRTVTLQFDGVDKDIAQLIRAGLVEQCPVARVGTTRVQREPSTILTHGDDGDLGVHDHPTRRDLTMTAELDIRDSANGLRFKGEHIQQGETITLDFGTVMIEATVITIGV